MTNLGFATDCIFHREDGFIEERADYWVIRTPSNPTYWYGNLLLFKRAPQSGDFARWHAAHAAEFGDTLKHITLAWDEAEPGDTADFLNASFKLDVDIVLSMARYAGGVKTNPVLTVRPVTDDAGWRDVIAIQQRCDSEDLDLPEDDGVFRATQTAATRRLVEAGRGNWWGAYLGEKLVGSMGLFFDRTQTLGRFQYVTTHPDYRRQRVCTTLLDHAIRHAFATVGPQCLVINTGNAETNPAKAVYQNVGFRLAHLSYAVIKLL